MPSRSSASAWSRSRALTFSFRKGPAAASMLRFKPGLGMLVAGTSVPVVPCHLEGTFEALPPHRKWPRFRKLTLRIGAPLFFSTVANERAGWEAIARATEAVVRGLAEAARSGCDRTYPFFFDWFPARR